MSEAHSDLLRVHLKTISAAALNGPFLDMACGKGRNGLYLIQNSIPTVFADTSQDALDQVKQQLSLPSLVAVNKLATLWPVDFETVPLQQLKKNSFAGVVVFRYLHRPLMASLKNAILPGGLVIYETFTVDQPLFGRPKNPDFLLRPGELSDFFSGWEVLHEYEGKIENYAGEQPAAIAQIVVRKPI